MRFGGCVLAGFRAQFLQTDAQRDGALAAHRIMSGLEHFPDDANAIADGAAVSIGSMIPLGKEKFVGQVAHASIDIHDVESGSARPSGGIRLPANDVTNVRGIHDA